MIGLIFSETHILIGEWSSRDNSLSSLKYFLFSKPIREILKSKEAIHKELSELLESISFKNTKVEIAIDNSLLNENSFEFEEEIDGISKIDYLQWAHVQRWGELDDFYDLTVDTPTDETCKVVYTSYPKFVLSELIKIIKNGDGNSVWAGSLKSIAKETVPFQPSANASIETTETIKRVPEKLLAGINGLMNTANFDYLLNFLNPVKVRSKNRKDKIDSKNIIRSAKEAHKTSLKTSTTKDQNIKRGRHKRNFILPFLFIVLIGLLAYFLLFTEQGKNIVSQVTNNVDEQVIAEVPVATDFLYDQYKQSFSLLMMYRNLMSVVSPDSIISLNIVDSIGKFEFVGTDSIDIPRLSITNYSIAPIACCGGIKQKLEFRLNTLQLAMPNFQSDIDAVLNQLQSSHRNVTVVRKDSIIENNYIYDPLIFNVDSLNNIEDLAKYLKVIGNNVIIRKIIITNSPPDGIPHGTFYVAVFR